MTEVETKNILKLGSALVVLVYLVTQLTENWQIPPAGPVELWKAWLGALGLAVGLEVLIDGLVAWRRRVRGLIRDERDAVIEARAALVGRGCVIVGVNVVIWQVLWEATLVGSSASGWDFSEASVIVFTLLAVLLIGQIVQRGLVIVLGRL